VKLIFDNRCIYYILIINNVLLLGTSALRYNPRYGQTDVTSAAQRQGQFGTLTRRHRPSLDYASDTEATCSSSPKSAYYYYRHNMNNPSQSSAVSHLATLSRSQIGQSSSGGLKQFIEIELYSRFRSYLDLIAMNNLSTDQFS